MQDVDVIREFLVESDENLSRLDQELVELEKHPKDVALLASIFRTIHTIKGTCGFLGYSTLEKIAHQAESLLSQLRDGHRELTPSVVSLILQTVDATRTVLACIESSGAEGSDSFDALTERLRAEARLTGFGTPVQRVTDFLDLNYVLQSAAGNWMQTTDGSVCGRRVLLADASAFSRGLIRSGLDMAGYRVSEASNLEEAIRGLERQPVDVVISTLDLSPDGTSTLVNAMRKRPEWGAIPPLALAEPAGPAQGAAMRAAGFQDCQQKFDRVAMIESLERLSSALGPAEAMSEMPVYAGGEW